MEFFFANPHIFIINEINRNVEKSNSTNIFPCEMCGSLSLIRSTFHTKKVATSFGNVPLIKSLRCIGVWYTQRREIMTVLAKCVFHVLNAFDCEYSTMR